MDDFFYGIVEWPDVVLANKKYLFRVYIKIVLGYDVSSAFCSSPINFTILR